MDIRQAIERRETILAEGSVYELLRRDPRVSFDPEIAHAGLVYDARSREILAAIHREYVGIGLGAGLPVLLFADTWRASAERIGRSRFAGLDVNGENVRFARELASETPGEVIVAAYTGPRGDAYRPAEAPACDAAMALHAPQIEALASSGVDLIVAATLPSFEEARGIAALLSRSRSAWMLSFVVRRGGMLLDGTPLTDAIARIDDEALRPPVGYAVNCVHPRVFEGAMRASGLSSSRVVSLQANASELSPEELDGSDRVEGDAPSDWADAMIEASRGSGLRIVGGCCGTSPEHMRALAERLAPGGGMT